MIRLLLRCFWPFLFIVFAVYSLRAELNLKPRQEDFELDGVKIPHLAFENGTPKKTTYQPPPNWTYAGSNNQLQLKPPEKAQVEVTITRLDVESVILFEPTNREKLKQRTIASLPEGSSDIKVESEELNALRISNKDTYLLQLSYSRFGARFKRYLLLLNLSSGQLQFQLTSREHDFAELMQAFQTSLYSWQNLT